MKTSALYIIATPIGNLKDLTLRAMEVLKEADLILAEDTRVTRKILNHLDIQKPVWRADEYAPDSFYKKVTEFLQAGKNVAFVSDAGTPGIADPGSKLVNYIHEYAPDIRIVPVPGPSAVTVLLSVAGINANEFTFVGYPPHKKGRETFFRELAEIKIRPIVLYESPHRLQKTLEGIEKALGENQNIIVGKELTKIYEEVWHGTPQEAEKYFKGEKGKGEFTIIIH